MIPFKELETERLFLKKFNYEDYLKVWKFDYRYYFGIPELRFKDKPISPEVFDNLKKYGNNEDSAYEKWHLENLKEIDWLVYFKNSNEVVGTIMTSYNKDFTECTNFGFMFLRKYWGNGYTYESASKVLDYLSDCGIESVKARANDTNIRSNKILQKLGFNFTGVKENIWTMVNGKEGNILVKECFYFKENSKQKNHPRL